MRRHIRFFSPVAPAVAPAPRSLRPIARGGAPVRTPKRSLAERERGLASASASPGSIGWPRGASNVGWASAGSPGSRREAARPRPERLDEELLDDAVLERVEGHHREAAAGLEEPLGGGEAAHELAELVVDRDAQGLEGARRRMGQLAAPRRGDAGDEPGKLERRGERLRRPVGDDGAGDAAGGALLAEMKQDVGDRRLVLVAQDVGGGAPARLPSACREARRTGAKSRAPPRRAASTTPRCRGRPRPPPRRRDARATASSSPKRASASRSRPPDEAASAGAGPNGRRVAVDGDDASRRDREARAHSRRRRRWRRHRGRRRVARARPSPRRAEREHG